jgi:hypothetical protein
MTYTFEKRGHGAKALRKSSRYSLWPESPSPSSGHRFLDALLNAKREGKALAPSLKLQVSFQETAFEPEIKHDHSKH